MNHFNDIDLEDHYVSLLQDTDVEDVGSPYLENSIGDDCKINSQKSIIILI